MTRRVAAMTDLNKVGRMPLERAIGIAGLIGTVLLFGSVIATSPREPPLDATAAQATAYLRGLDKDWMRPVEVVGHLGMMALLWFLVGLGLLLRRVEGDLPLRSTLATLSGVLVAAFVILDPSQDAATHRLANLNSGQLVYAYESSTIGFTNAWLAMGSFAFASGWVITSTRAMPRWLGWWGLLSGTTLGLAPLIWTIGSVWVAPYAGFWLWLLTTCVWLVRRSPTAIAHTR
jgi:hypothetical protein